MRFLWVAIALLLASFLGVANAFDFHEKDLDSEESIWDLYERWRSHHTVSTSLDEKHKRFNVFKENVMHVHNTNKMDKPYKLKLNKFADMTNHEFRSMYAGSKVKHHRMFRGTPRGSESFMHERVGSVPASVDWRLKGAVTGIKDQGRCGKENLVHLLLALPFFFFLFLVFMFILFPITAHHNHINLKVKFLSNSLIPRRWHACAKYLKG